MVNIGTVNGLMYVLHQDIFQTKSDFGSSGLSFSDQFIMILNFPFKKFHLKISSAKMFILWKHYWVKHSSKMTYFVQDSRHVLYVVLSRVCQTDRWLSPSQVNIVYDV